MIAMRDDKMRAPSALATEIYELTVVACSHADIAALGDGEVPTGVTATVLCEGLPDTDGLTRFIEQRGATVIRVTTVQRFLEPNSGMGAINAQLRDGGAFDATPIIESSQESQRLNEVERDLHNLRREVSSGFDRLASLIEHRIGPGDTAPLTARAATRAPIRSRNSPSGFVADRADPNRVEAEYDPRAPMQVDEIDLPRASPDVRIGGGAAVEVRPAKPARGDAGADVPFQSRRRDRPGATAEMSNGEMSIIGRGASSTVLVIGNGLDQDGNPRVVEAGLPAVGDTLNHGTRVD